MAMRRRRPGGRRWLSPFISRMWTRWVRFSEAKTSVRSLVMRPPVRCSGRVLDFQVGLLAVSFIRRAPSKVSVGLLRCRFAVGT